MSRVKKKCPKIVFYLENPLTAAYGVFGHSFLVTEMVRITAKMRQLVVVWDFVVVSQR